MTKNRTDPLRRDRPIYLAVSGGGTRAALAGGAVLLGLLTMNQQVCAIAAVSGSALYMARLLVWNTQRRESGLDSQPTNRELRKELDNFARRGFSKRLRTRALFSVGTSGVSLLLFLRFVPQRWDWWPAVVVAIALLPWLLFRIEPFSLDRRSRRTTERWRFMRDVRPEHGYFATQLVSPMKDGTKFRFGAVNLQKAELEWLDPFEEKFATCGHRLSLYRKVAASAALPVVLESPTLGEPRYADGGLFDNHGVGCFVDPLQGDLPADAVVIIVDAASSKPSPPQAPVVAIGRSLWLLLAAALARVIAGRIGSDVMLTFPLPLALAGMFSVAIAMLSWMRAPMAYAARASIWSLHQRSLREHEAKLDALGIWHRRIGLDPNSASAGLTLGRLSKKSSQQIIEHYESKCIALFEEAEGDAVGAEEGRGAGSEKRLEHRCSRALGEHAQRFGLRVMELGMRFSSYCSVCGQRTHRRSPAAE